MGEKLEVERLAASEALRLVRRDSRQYTKQIAGMYVSNLVFEGLTFDDARLARAAYFYVRHIDDALDGEHSGYPNSQATPEQLPVNLAELDSSKHPIAKLGRYAMKGLAQRQKPNDKPVEDMQRLVNSMAFDYERSQNGAVFSDKTDLQSYFSNMARGTNLMFMGFRSVLREDIDLPHFANGTGRVQSARDLREDWLTGIYNIPADALTDISPEYEPGYPLPTYGELIQLNGFVEWQIDQLHQAHTELTESKSIADDIGKSDAGARVIVLRAEQTLGYIPKIKEDLANAA